MASGGPIWPDLYCYRLWLDLQTEARRSHWFELHGVEPVLLYRVSAAIRNGLPRLAILIEDAPGRGQTAEAAVVVEIDLRGRDLCRPAKFVFDPSLLARAGRTRK